MFLKQFGELSAIRSQRLVAPGLLDATVFHHDDRVYCRQNGQRVGRKHASLQEPNAHAKCCIFLPRQSLLLVVVPKTSVCPLILFSADIVDSVVKIFDR